jgi:hypothetical protein
MLASMLRAVRECRIGRPHRRSCYDWSKSIVIGSKARDEVQDESRFVLVANIGPPALHLVDFGPPLRFGKPLLQDHVGSVAPEAVHLRQRPRLARREHRNLRAGKWENRSALRGRRIGRSIDTLPLTPVEEQRQNDKHDDPTTMSRPQAESHDATSIVTECQPLWR